MVDQKILGVVLLPTQAELDLDVSRYIFCHNFIQMHMNNRFVEQTPQRAQNVGRILKNGAINATKIIKTREGAEVFQSASAATRSLTMAISSPAGRQFVVDSATGLVKVAEALTTRESKNVLQQSAVVLGRGQDAVSTRHAKIFLEVCVSEHR